MLDGHQRYTELLAVADYEAANCICSALDSSGVPITVTDLNPGFLISVPEDRLAQAQVAAGPFATGNERASQHTEVQVLPAKSFTNPWALRLVWSRGTDAPLAHRHRLKLRRFAADFKIYTHPESRSLEGNVTTRPLRSALFASAWLMRQPQRG